MARSYIFITSIFSLTILAHGAIDIAKYKEMEIIDDLPVKSNLEKYLLSLEKIVYFVNSHRLYVDMNLNFGVFLINVNLRSTLKARGHRLPVNKRVRLERILKTNDEIIKYFVKMVLIHLPQLDSFDAPVGMVNLFSNETSWPHHLRQFNIDILNMTKFYTRKELEVVYAKWNIYKTKVFNIETHSPTPAESDTCLALLAQNPINENLKLVHCQVPYTCAKLILHGTNFGYGLTHRMLFLILSRFSRGCSLASPTQDIKLLDSWCAKIYNEAELISLHDFELADLFMEQISLCGLEGHAQFLRRSWVEELLDFQTGSGCFNVSRPYEDDFNKEIPRPENIAWQFTITDHMIMGNTCNVHTTAVAAGMLAAAIRYILENYY